MSRHVCAEEWARWEAERVEANQAYDDECFAREVRRRPLIIAQLCERVETLETREWFAREMLAAAVEVADDLRERLAFVERLLADVLAENRIDNVVPMERAA